MSEMGEPSRVMEEELFEVTVVWEEQPIAALPSPVVASAGIEYEVDQGIAMTDPDVPMEELTEQPELSSPVLDSFEVGMIGEMADRIIQMERDIRHRQEVETHLESIVHFWMSQHLRAAERIAQLEERVQTERAEREALRAQLEDEVMARIQAEEQRDAAHLIVGDLEAEVVSERQQTTRMGYAFHTAFGRWIDRIRHYPVEQGQTHHTLSRDVAVHMGRIEYRSAMERGMIP